MKKENVKVGRTYKLFSLKTLEKRGLIKKDEDGYYAAIGREYIGTISNLMAEEWNNPITITGIYHGIPKIPEKRYDFYTRRGYCYRAEWIRCRYKKYKKK